MYVWFVQSLGRTVDLASCQTKSELSRWLANGGHALKLKEEVCEKAICIELNVKQIGDFSPNKRSQLVLKMNAFNNIFYNLNNIDCGNTRNLCKFTFHVNLSFFNNVLSCESKFLSSKINNFFFKISVQSCKISSAFSLFCLLFFFINIIRLFLFFFLL